MKKIAKKLLFSSLALGASVLTLTTTTYAWYVQNNTATAANVQASTKDEQGKSLFITKNYTGAATTTWGASFDFNNGENGDFAASNAMGNEKDAFVPISYDTTQTRFEYSDAEAATGGKLVVNMWLMSTVDNVKVLPVLRLANTTTSENVRTQTAYTEVKGTSNNLVEKNAQFWTDAAQALRMSMVTQPVGGSASAATYYDVMAVGKKYELANNAYEAYAAINCPNTANTITTVKETELGEYTFTTAPTPLKGAHGYFRTLVGGNPAFGYTPQITAIGDTVRKENAGQENETIIGQAGEMNYITVGTTPVKVTITIWLEGTDVSCFDCCAKQDFKFAFDFKTVNANA